MSTPLTEAEFKRHLRDFEATAFRLELQRAYDEPTERDTVARFLAGEPQPPIEVPSLAAWFEQVSRQTAAGKTITRVRVQEDPPTGYQQWERWIGEWNERAGEQFIYLTRQQAHEIGLLPDAGSTDWWLLDDQRLIVMRFNDTGRRISTELEDDPQAVAQARTWRDLAVRPPQRKGATP